MPVVGEVPPGVVTVTSTVPALWDGETATTWVLLIQLWTARMPPKRTVIPVAVKFVPSMVTIVLPEVGPVLGVSSVTVGPPV